MGDFLKDGFLMVGERYKLRPFKIDLENDLHRPNSRLEFREFCVVRESLYPRNRLKRSFAKGYTREIFETVIRDFSSENWWKNAQK